MLHIVSTPCTPPNAIAGQDETIFLYVVSFFFAALGVISIDTLGNVASGLSGEWVLAFGLATLVPFALELMLERGAGGVFAWLASLPVSVFFYAFQNKVIAESVEKGLRTGIASYVNTGTRLPWNVAACWAKVSFRCLCAHVLV